MVFKRMGLSAFVANSASLSMRVHTAILRGFVAVRFAHHNLCGLFVLKNKKTINPQNA